MYWSWRPSPWKVMIFFLLISLDFDWSDIPQFWILNTQHFKKYFSPFHFIKWILPWMFPSVPQWTPCFLFLPTQQQLTCFEFSPTWFIRMIFCTFSLFNYITPLLLNLCKHPLNLLQFDFLSSIVPKKRKWWAEKMMLVYILFAILITALWIWTH